MSDRIEPIRATQEPVTAVAAVAPRDRRRDDEPPRERPRRREPVAPVTRDEDGTPHVDVRA